MTSNKTWNHDIMTGANAYCTTFDLNSQWLGGSDHLLLV